MSPTSVSKLTQSEGTRLHTFEGTASDGFDLATSIAIGGTPKAVVRVVRGTKSRSSNSLFDELAAAWQFPPYFGENWDAVDECMDDLEWLPGEHYILLVTDAHLLLKDEKPEALRLFIDLVKGLRGTSKAATFHMVFQTDKGHSAAFKTRLNAVGGKPEPLS